MLIQYAIFANITSGNMQKGVVNKLRADKIVFFVCLIISIGLFIGGFFVPPMGVIDGSILTAGGELLGFAALAVGAQAIADGRKATIKHGKTELNINDEDGDTE